MNNINLTCPKEILWNPKTHWETHPSYDAEDWQSEVGSNETRLGYTDWVNVKIDTNYQEHKINDQLVCSSCGFCAHMSHKSMNAYKDNLNRNKVFCPACNEPDLAIITA